jgi:hypothetical protein
MLKTILKKQKASGNLKLELNDKNYVSQSDKGFVTITSPRGTRKFTIPKVKGKIKSSQFKRLELMHI